MRLHPPKIGKYHISGKHPINSIKMYLGERGGGGVGGKGGSRGRGEK
jgi:hypothetical protein